MKSKKIYDNYFQNHYRLSFSSKDFDNFNKWFAPQWKLIKKTIIPHDRISILEIGSAYGGLYGLIKRDYPNCKYLGLELDEGAVKFSNEYFGDDCFINKSFENYSLAKQVDFVFAFEVLEHMDDPFGAIEKIHSLLKTSGKFIGSSPFPYPKNIFADKTHRYVLHPRNWEKLFLEIGFKKVELYPMSFVPVIWRLSRHLNIRIPFYTRFPGMISTTLIVARK